MMAKRYILVLAGLLTAQILLAQGGATIKASVDKNKILIGEPIRLKVTAYISTGSSLQFPPIDSIEHFEMLEKPSVDSTEKDGGIEIEKLYTITSFDSGRWAIPSFVISPAFQSDSIPIDVIFSEFDANQDYHDIKDILDVKPAKKKFPWWYIAAGVLLVCIAIYLYRRRKQQKVTTINVPKLLIDPYEEAMGSLNALWRNRPASKDFYSKLTNIFRQYVFQKKGILSLQKTTDDLVIQLKGLGLPPEQFDKLSQSLRISDFVKFAKYIPSGEDDHNCFNDVRNAITSIEGINAGNESGLKKG